MSGGTWDYRDRQVLSLAEDLRFGNARWLDTSDEPLEFLTTRIAIAELLELIGRLLHDLDWHYAGDSYIPDEQAWLTEAKMRVLNTLDAWFRV